MAAGSKEIRAEDYPGSLQQEQWGTSHGPRNEEESSGGEVGGGRAGPPEQAPAKAAAQGHRVLTEAAKPEPDKHSSQGQGASRRGGKVPDAGGPGDCN